MKPGFFLREALRALKRNAVPSFAAVATVLVTVLVLGVFIPVVQATTGAANDVRSRVIADVYLKTDATQADIDRVRTEIDTRVPHVKSVQFVCKEQAYKQQSRNSGVTEHIEMPNRDHSLVIDQGWREVAEKALAFVQRFA